MALWLMVGRNGVGSVEHVVGVLFLSFFPMVMQDIRRQQ
jgi:hypothetical protein